MPGRTRILGILVGTSLVVATCLKGSSEPWARAVFCVVAAACAWCTSTTRGRVGAANPWLGAWGIGMVLLATAWIPLPSGVLSWIAPGIVEARPGRWWDTLGYRPELTLEAAAVWTGLCAVGAGASVWAGRPQSRRLVVPAAVVLGGGIAGVALLHRVMDARSVLGMIPVSEPTSSMFLPFVNVNHLGAALVIFLPLLVGNLLDEGISGARSGAVLVAVTAIGALLLGCGSASAMLVGVGVVVLTLWHWSRRRLGFVVPSLVGGLVVALVFPYTSPHLLSRLPMWRDTLSLIADHPLTGVGAGSYGYAIESYRTDQFFLTWSHAHNETLEFLAEFGAVGLVGLLLVFSLLRLRQDPRKDPIRIRLLLGLLGLAMHSLVEFPLRLTSVALSGVVAWGVLLGFEQTPSARSERSIRRFLRTAAPLLLLGSGWLLRTQYVEKTVSAVRSADRSVVLSEKQVLAWTAPWRGEEKLHRAWQSLQRNDTEKALGLAAQIRQEHPDDAGLLMRVSILQAKGGDLPGAGATIDRAAERNPWDYRPHVLAARLFFAGGDVEASAAAWTEAFSRQAPTALLPEAMKAQALGLWWVSALVDHSPVYSFTLAILLSEEDPKVARLAMDQAAYLAPDFYGHRAFHAELMRRSGDLRGAEAFLKEALFLQPEGSSLWQSLSRLRASQERWMEARDAMLKAAGFHRVLRAQALMAIEKADGPGSVQVQYETWKRRGPVGDGVSYRAALARYRASDPLGCVLILEEADLLVSQTYGERAETLMARCRW